MSVSKVKGLRTQQCGLLLVMVEDVTVPVTEEAVYSVDEEWRDVEVVEFPDHLVMLNDVKGRPKVDEEEPGEVTG